MARTLPARDPDSYFRLSSSSSAQIPVWKEEEKDGIHFVARVKLKGADEEMIFAARGSDRQSFEQLARESILQALIKKYVDK